MANNCNIYYVYVNMFGDTVYKKFARIINQCLQTTSESYFGRTKQFQKGTDLFQIMLLLSHK